MISVEQNINKYKLFNSGDIVGVAVSGGIDSMTLLTYLFKNKEKFDIDVIAINIDHSIRNNSASDSLFVAEYCKKNHIRHYKFKVDALAIAHDKKQTVEEAAREARYGVFDSLIKKGIVDKIALGHHASDQVETVLLNIFRGAGINGASGMNFVRDEYVRPMLFTTKDEITSYALENEINYVEDETNFDNNYSRNFIRNKIIPLLQSKWKNVETNILNFSKICNQDNEYIEKQINYDAVVFEENLIKIPLNYFVYPQPIVNRMLKKCFEEIGVNKDIEKKHYDMIKSMVRQAENGTKISLPNGLIVQKEYDFISISVKKEKQKFTPFKFDKGHFNVENYGEIVVKKSSTANFKEGEHKIDFDKLPQDAIWRLRQEGDVFAKFGSGTKKLKEYFIDKKIPTRIRSIVPVLAFENEIYVVAGYDISEKLKVDENTKTIYSINYHKD